ncbi:type II toxin-antitoxin system RelE/ParE family toxin [Sphingomonas gilva]|uniref:Type II toxin-antitoxin system RelE/ParE family toxin n=1 Tax=Sphingomonas gilva TaxID=2305907 RepID=A0A396RJJ3_9SPHN|nr:type II toxin-antitoxin system RelE/ParE family toxin [Sphingomonas gilva]RHW16327.1 type II toxin-antitoxin system RelE/ParE family toxin [Sphingomonas gilva]
MLKLIWKAEAEHQFNDIVGYIEALSPDGAKRITRLILDGLNRARNFPHIGRPGRVAGTRELIVHPNYIVIYRITPDAIDVLRILHARQLYP